MRTMRARDIINKLGMPKIPEGGMCAENCRAGTFLEGSQGKRMMGSTIYYLLEKGDFSCFHRLKSDEIWMFHMGALFTIHIW